MPSLADWWSVLRRDVAAWRRGERRIVPRFDVNGRPVSGRTHARPEEAGRRTPTKTRLKATMRYRVWRAATGTWEDPVEVPAKVEVKE
jgi:hypothetical protein